MKLRDMQAIVVQVDDATPGDRVIVSRLRNPDAAKPIVLELHYRYREADDLSMGRYAYRVAFFELDDETAGEVMKAIGMLRVGK